MPKDLRSLERRLSRLEDESEALARRQKSIGEDVRELREDLDEFKAGEEDDD